MWSPHLQKWVIWEKGAGMPIRSHTQQEKVKHRKVIIWKGLNVQKRKNKPLNILKNFITRTQLEMELDGLYLF